MTDPAMADLPAGVAANLSMAERVMARCDALAGLSSMDNGICRTYLSAEHAAANALVGDWMRDAGMQVTVDAVGNVCGRYAPDEQRRQLVLGSHLDTVPDAGRYDGILGVLSGIAVVELCREQGVALPFGLEVVGFGEEEGVRFGATLMGSRGFAGTWDPAWAGLEDEHGTTLTRAMADFGLDIYAVDAAARDPATLAGYLELHIEQGPVLEAENLPVGVVTGIAGAQRLKVTLDGQAAHAGTTPMHLRRDALVTAAAIVQLVEATALKLGVVATVGQLVVEPGGVNVVPGRVVLSVDVRSIDGNLLQTAVDAIVRELQAAAAERQIRCSVEATHRAAPVACSQDLMAATADAISAQGLRVLALPSGAGHDAMAIAPICEVGMIFVRCTAGLSHNPAERITPGDVAWGLTVLHGSVLELAHQTVGAE